MSRNSTTGMLLSVQYLRGIAALMVVCHHSQVPQAWLFSPFPDLTQFARGVDIFFVISGFIIFTAARDEKFLQFAKRRIIRIAPLYWFATVGFAALSIFHLVARPWSIEQLLQSMLFIPHIHPKSGEIWPYLVPGWTLNYEIFFYAVFALGIASGRVIAFTSITICTFVLAGLAFDPQQVGPLFYTRPIILEFLAGMFIARAYQRNVFRGAWIGLFPGFALLFWTGEYRDFVVGSGAALIVVGALSLERKMPRLALLKLLGDASYSVYLFHLFAVTPMTMIWMLLPLQGWTQFLVVVFGNVIAGTLLGLFCYRFIERPLLRALLRRPKPEPSLLTEAVIT